MKKMAVFFVCIAAFMWSICGILIKFLYQKGFTVDEITFVKVALSLVIVYAIIKASKEKIEKIGSFKDFILFAVSGCIGYLMYGFLYAKSVTYIPISAAIVLVYLAPIIVMIASVFLFKEKLTKRKILCLVLVVVGCILVEGLLTENLANLSIKGIIIGVMSGGCYALNTICNKVLIKKYTVYSVTFYNFLFAFFLIFFVADKSTLVSTTINSGVSGFLLLIIFAVSSGSASHMLYIKALEHLEAGKASLITIIEPLTASVLGILIFKESVNIYKTIGFIMIITALVLVNRIKSTEITEPNQS